MSSVLSGIVEGAGNVIGAVGKAAVGGVNTAVGAVSSAVGSGKGAPASHAVAFTVSIQDLVIEDLGTSFKGELRPLLGLTLKEHSFSARQKEKALGAWALGQPLAFGKASFELQGQASDTLCIELWSDQLADVFLARACLPLASLANAPQTHAVALTSDTASAGLVTVNTLVGQQHAIGGGFRATAKVTLTRLQPSA